MEREFNTVHCVLGPGAIFGEGSMFGESERMISARSSMQTTLLSIRATDLDNLLQGYPEIVEQLRVRAHHPEECSGSNRIRTIHRHGCLRRCPWERVAYRYLRVGRVEVLSLLTEGVFRVFSRFAVYVRAEGGCTQNAHSNPQGAMRNGGHARLRPCSSAARERGSPAS